MTAYLLLCLTGAALALVLTPLVRAAALAFGLVDAPGGRKVHSASVPRIGGLAVVAAAGLALAGTSWPGVSTHLPDPVSLKSLAPILTGAVLIYGIGLFDDLRPLPVWPKLGIEAAAAVTVMLSGILIEHVTVAGTTWPLGWLAWPVTFAWIVGMTNAFNLIDGLDGLAAGTAAIAGAACTIILVRRGHAAEAMLLATLVGACLGFLAFNFTPATIFLGDSGSLTLGFVLAATAITGWQKGATAIAAGVPLLIFALPIADALAAAARRARPRPGGGRHSVRQALRQMAQPDRKHIHHRLTAQGWSVRRTVLVLYVVTIALSALAVTTARFD
jgi:UDP-GlcNAc:undecaprenyl-phosphate GlcNAc-1-phosphate transferase